jgi:membrane protease YdiL (CAAX protease family)
MTRNRLAAADPFLIAVLFEAALIPLALLLALPLGLAPWRAFGVSVLGLVTALFATVPLVVALALFGWIGSRWFREVESLVRPLIDALFRGRGVPAVLLVSALAGVGEELLFRGVIQAGLSASFGPWPGLLMAAVLFGLMHALSRAYFVLATLMGVYLGVLYQATGSLLIPAIVHGLYDAVAIGYLLWGRDGGRGAHREPVE